MPKVDLIKHYYTLIVIVGILGERSEGLIVEEYHLNCIKDAPHDVSVDQHHIDYLRHNGNLVKPVILSRDIEQYLLQVNSIINSYRYCQSQKTGKFFIR